MGSVVVAHGLCCPWHVGSSQSRDWTHVPCVGRWILNHWTTREVHPCYIFWKEAFGRELNKLKYITNYSDIVSLKICKEFEFCLLPAIFLIIKCFFPVEHSEYFLWFVNKLLFTACSPLESGVGLFWVCRGCIVCMLVFRKWGLSFQTGWTVDTVPEEGLLPGDWSQRESEAPQILVFTEAWGESQGPLSLVPGPSWSYLC